MAWMCNSCGMVYEYDFEAAQCHPQITEVDEETHEPIMKQGSFLDVIDDVALGVLVGTAVEASGIYYNGDD